jgi:hypothetical protein
VYGPGGQTTTILGGGGSEIAGTSFSTDGHLQLFESEESRHWDFDPSTCAFNPTTAAPCAAPTLVDGDVLPGGRQRGDAASAVLPVTVPITVTKIIDGAGSGTFDIGASATNGGAPSTDRTSLAGGQTDTVAVTTSDGAVVVDEVQQAGWTLESATCGAPGEVVALGAATVSFTITPGQQVACTFTNVASPTGPDSVTTTTVPTTTTTVPTTATTTVPATTTSAAAATTTTTDAAENIASDPLPTVLPFTGGGANGLPIGLGLLAVGMAAVGAGRRRRDAARGRRRD